MSTVNEEQRNAVERLQEIMKALHSVVQESLETNAERIQNALAREFYQISRRRASFFCARWIFAGWEAVITVAWTKINQESFIGLCLSSQRSSNRWAEQCLLDPATGYFFKLWSNTEPSLAIRPQDSVTVSIKFWLDGRRNRSTSLLERSVSYRRHFAGMFQGIQRASGDVQMVSGTKKTVDLIWRAKQDRFWLYEKGFVATISISSCF